MAGLLLAASIYASQRPYYNWDMFPYMALASRCASTPFAETHAQVYHEAERLLPAPDYRAISQRQPVLRDNPDAFEDVLKYFSIKPGYLLMVRLAYLLGLDLVTSTYLPSVISYFFIGMLLFFWSRKSLPVPAAFLLTVVTATTPFLVQTARYSSPDLLCALVLFAGLYLALEHSLIPGLLVTGLAITVRPDAVIVCLLFILALYLGRMASLRIALAVAAASLVLTLLVIGDPRLLREFLFTDADYSLSWNTMEMRHHYLTSVRMGLPTIWQTSALVFMTLGMTGLFLRRKNPRGSGDLWSMLMVAAMASMIIRYLLHPVIEDRFLVTEYLLIIMGLCKTWQDLLKPPRMILP